MYKYLGGVQCTQQCCHKVVTPHFSLFLQKFERLTFSFLSAFFVDLRKQSVKNNGLKEFCTPKKLSVDCLILERIDC